MRREGLGEERNSIKEKGEGNRQRRRGGKRRE